MASTSDRFDGTFPKKHAEAAAIGLIPIACMPPIDGAIGLAADGWVVLLVHGRDHSMLPILPQHDEDGVDVIEIILRRANDLRVVRHGDLTERFTY